MAPITIYQFGTDVDEIIDMTNSERGSNKTTLKLFKHSFYKVHGDQWIVPDCSEEKYLKEHHMTVHFKNRNIKLQIIHDDYKNHIKYRFFNAPVGFDHFKQAALKDFNEVHLKINLEKMTVTAEQYEESKNKRVEIVDRSSKLILSQENKKNFKNPDFRKKMNDMDAAHIHKAGLDKDELDLSEWKKGQYQGKNALIHTDGHHTLTIVSQSLYEKHDEGASRGKMKMSSLFQTSAAAAAAVDKKVGIDQTILVTGISGWKTQYEVLTNCYNIYVWTASVAIIGSICAALLWTAGQVSAQLALGATLSAALQTAIAAASAPPLAIVAAVVIVVLAVIIFPIYYAQKDYMLGFRISNMYQTDLVITQTELYNSSSTTTPSITPVIEKAVQSDGEITFHCLTEQALENDNKFQGVGIFFVFGKQDNTANYFSLVIRQDYDGSTYVRASDQVNGDIYKDAEKYSKADIGTTKVVTVPYNGTSLKCQYTLYQNAKNNYYVDVIFDDEIKTKE